MTAPLSLHPRSVALSLSALALAGAVWMAGPPAADARGGTGGGDGERSEVRAAGSCGAGARSELRIRQDDSRAPISAEFSVDATRRSRWRLVVTHERDVVWRGTLRAKAITGQLRLVRILPDYDGPDTISVRAWGPNGLTCRAVAQLVEHD